MDGIARRLNSAGWFVTNEFLRLWLGEMQLVNPWVPKRFWCLMSQGFLKFSDLVNRRWLLDPIMTTGTSLAIDFVRPEHGDVVAKDTEEFLRLGIDGHKVERGSGNTADPENCFFPESLAIGPSLDPLGTSPLVDLHNVEIAQSCALLSMLSYRHDDDIVTCLVEHGMLPGTSFFSVHTLEDGDLAIFAADDETWAAFCFRGTEPETLRDWLTSALLTDPVPFDSLNPDDGIKVRARYFAQMKSAAFGTGLEFQTGNISAPFRAHHCANDLALALIQRGCRVYCTGHSLGGGLSTLFGAHVRKFSGLTPAGIVTFGSPPVGNQKFCHWFGQCFKSHINEEGETKSVSWRFVNSDEFAPMAPPLPFVNPNTAEQFHHVGGLIRAESLLDATDYQRTQEEMTDRMRELAGERKLTKIILDHNPATVLRGLRQHRKIIVSGSFFHE